MLRILQKSDDCRRMTLPVHVLSLPRLAARRSTLSAALDSLGVGYRLHDGFDRLDVDPAEVKRLFGADGALGDVCCTLGHLAIWQKVAASGRAALVLEDDATISAALVPWVEARATEVMERHGLGVLKLEAWGGAGLNRTRPLGRRTREAGVWRLAGRFVGSAAYAITAEAAERLSAVCERPGRPVDHLLFAPPFAVPAGFVAPAPVLHDVSRWDSDISRADVVRPPRREAILARLAGARRVEVAFVADG